MQRHNNDSRLFRLLALLVCAAFPLALAACNTTEGVGEDVEAAGEAIDEAAEDSEY